MMWGFLLGSADISGGTYVIFEHAIRIQRSGIDVVIITNEKVTEERLNWHTDAKILSFKTYDEVKDDSFEIVFATWWKTVFELYRIKAQKYAYFVQSIESRFYDKSDLPLIKLVDSTYSLPLYFLTEAKWIKKYLKDIHNKNSYLVPNGIRKDVYSVEGDCFEKRNSYKLRVLVEGHINVPFKNVKKTIELCKKSNADEIWLLTASDIKSYDGVDKVFSRVPIFETAKIYRSCDIIIKLSYVEGMFGPPLEMFHCGGTSITYDVTGHDEYIIANKNGLVAKTDDDKSVIRFINRLKKDSSFLNYLKQNAVNTAEVWPNWDEVSNLFIENSKNIINCCEKQDIKDIGLLTKSSFEWYELAEFYRKNFKKPNSLFVFIKRVSNKIFPKFYLWLRKTRAKIDGRA